MPTTPDFPVKWLHSGMPRAPVLCGQAGALIGVLDALLVTGWGAITPQRIEVAGGIATVTCNSGDTFLEHTVIEISGAEQPELNGQHRVLSSAATSFTFATDAADGFATGTISIKAASAGWEKVFSGENRAVYKSIDVRSGGYFFRVDDSVGTYAEIRGFASMDDVDSGQFPFPDTAKTAYIHKSDAASAAARTYDIFADALFCLAAMQHKPTSGNVGGVYYAFGDPLAIHPSGADLTCAMLCARDDNSVTGYVRGACAIGGRGLSVMSSCAVGRDGVTVAPALARTPFSGAASGLDYSGADGTFGAVADAGRIFLSRSVFLEGAIPRCVLPGAYTIPQSGARAAITPRATAQAAIAGASRSFVALQVAGNAYNSGDNGACFVDITGPWR